MSFFTTFLHDTAFEPRESTKPLAVAPAPTGIDLQDVADVPLVVDLDGSLIRTDLLVESAFAHIGQKPFRLINTFLALFRGKAQLKAYLAGEVQLDAATLPYDEDVLALIKEARTQGRRIFLASASNELYVSAVADHLGLFDGWFASTHRENLSAEAKARRLSAAFGASKFDYIGNDAADLPVWQVARKRIAVRPSAAVKAKLMAFAPDASVLASKMGSLRIWAKLLRIQQWAKNALIFVPLMTAQRFDLLSGGKAMAAALLFSFAASSIYILNDLVDVSADRVHPTKRRRPLAAGTIAVHKALIVAFLLLSTALVGGFALAPAFGAVLLCYGVLTTAYTFSLKRKMMIDVVTLAALYSIRVVAGAAAISVPLSEWLLAFSMFIFTALALVKRHTELATLLDANLPDPKNRNYQKSDLDIVAILAGATAFNAVTVFALYISSDAVHALYRHPKALWLICPILMYWLGRLLILAHRRLMHEDPVIFALKDWNSFLSAACILVILVGAI